MTSKSHKLTVFVALMAAAGWMAACSLPLPFGPVTTPDLTSVYQTVAVNLTGTTTANPKPGGAATSTPAAKATPPPETTLSVTPVCNRASAGNPIDVTITDGTVLHPGEDFTKTWRLVNTGDCAWTTEYAVVWFLGERFGASPTNILSSRVESGQAADFSLDMIAPTQPGVYQSYWKLSDPQGNLFGIGPEGAAPFWVRIVVSAVDTPTPTQPPTPAFTHPTLAAGLANLVPNDGIDLDKNLVNNQDGVDLSYKLESNGAHQLVPLRNTRLAVFGPNRPTYADCTGLDLKADPVKIEDHPANTFICYRTNLGLPGWLRLIFLNTQDNILTVEILTWAGP